MSGLEALLILHLLCIILAVGIAMTNIINTRLAASQTGDILKGLNMHRLAMLPYADAAIVGFVVTGLLMLWMIGGPSTLSDWFKLKMLAVLVILVGYGTIRYTIAKARRTGNMALLTRVKLITPINLVAAIVAVTCAVLTFK